MKGKKFSAHIGGGALAVIAVWAIGMQVTVPPEVAVAFGVVVTMLVSWIIPDELEADE